MSALTYLHIRGTLAENMVYTPRPGFESPRAGRPVEGDPAFELVLLDDNGRMLVSVRPQVSARGCGHAGDPRRFRVRGALPLHPKGASYELRRGEISLYKASVPRESPRISPPNRVTTERGLELSWQAIGNERITYSVVALMESGKRFTIARGLAEPRYTVDLTQMPASGKGKVIVVVNDGVRSSEVEAASIDVPIRPPSVHVLTPIADARVPFGQPLSILGCCLDMGGKPCSPELAVWSLDGERFALGSWITVLEKPQPGTHRLTLEYGKEGDRVETSVILEIEEPDDDDRQWEELMAEHIPGSSLT